MNSKNTYLFTVDRAKSPILFKAIIFLFPQLWVYHTTEQPSIAIFYK